MTFRYGLNISAANLDLLSVELRAACPVCTGATHDPDQARPYGAILQDGASAVDEAACDSVAVAHNPQGETPEQTLKSQLKSDAQAIVGLDWTALTNAQLKILVGVLLYKAKAIKPDLTIAPLNQWDI